MKVTKRRDLERIAVEEELLTAHDIGRIMYKPCKSCRTIAGSAVSNCPHDLKCNSKFHKDGGNEELLLFRQKFWENNWKNVLITELNECSSIVGETRVFAFHIGGTSVCKHFFRAVTGLSRQVFDKAYANVINRNTPIKYPLAISHNNGSMHSVLGFLDSFFSGYRVQHDPTCEKKAMLYNSWQTLYQQDYKDFCKFARIVPVSYSRFCSIRHKHRTGYIVAKTFRSRKGWNHMACDTCENYQSAIKETNCHKTMKELDRGFKDHIERMVRILTYTLSL